MTSYTRANNCSGFWTLTNKKYSSGYPISMKYITLECIKHPMLFYLPNKQERGTCYKLLYSGVYPLYIVATKNNQVNRERSIVVKKNTEIMYVGNGQWRTF